MVLRSSIDDLDALIVELTELRQTLSVADLRGNPDDALWEAESRLRHVASRATTRADIVRRAIDVLASDRRRIA